MKHIQQNPTRKPEPLRDIYCRAIVDRIAADPTLGICGLTSEAMALFLKASELTDMPSEWIVGRSPMDTDCVESISILVYGVLKAIDEELNEPTRPLHVVTGGET